MSDRRRERDRDRKARQRAHKRGGETIMVQIDDPEAWREILTLRGIPKTMSLGAATAHMIFDLCRAHRKALADEAWDAIGKITIGHLDMMQMPTSFEPELVKPVSNTQTPFREMDGEQRELAEVIEEAEYREALEDAYARANDDGGWAKAEEGGWRQVKVPKIDY